MMVHPVPLPPPSQRSVQGDGNYWCSPNQWLMPHPYTRSSGPVWAGLWRKYRRCINHVIILPSQWPNRIEGAPASTSTGLPYILVAQTKYPCYVRNTTVTTRYGSRGQWLLTCTCISQHHWHRDKFNGQASLPSIILLVHCLCGYHFALKKLDINLNN